ncbi:MAG: serine/threonine protein kinase [Planctomycetes bacterium]|nr:serine/threonine protein kinase [Planctomycetota bacterium]
MNSCPDPDALARAVQDPETAPAEILEHLAACQRCRDLLDQNEQPTKWDWLGETEHKHEPKTWFLDRLKAAVRYTVTGPPEPDEPGPNVPGYAIEAEIARGGMGVVYRARDIALGRTVAIKVLRSDLVSHPTQLARFLGEAKALAALSHPNVVQLFQAGESDGKPYLVMEHVADGTLRHAMQTGSWDPIAAAQLVCTLADATAAVHRIGVIHRDLKPGNVLMSANHERTFAGPSALRPKIADFGLARFLESADRLTRTGDVFGTPEFMAPEQARGDHVVVGPETDVWSLGVILYEVLTGRPPFVGMTSIETLQLVKLSPPVSPELVRPGIPPDLVAICLKCLEKKPTRRYRTAESLRDDLDRFLANQPVLALPRSPLGRTALALRREPMAVLGWLLIASVMLAAVGLVLWQRHLARIAATVSAAEIAHLHAQHESTIRELYAVRITLAVRAIADGDFMDAEAWLALCRPADGEPDPRGWEWNYLMNRLHSRAQIELRLADTDKHGFEDVKLVPSTEAFSPDQRRRATIDVAGRLLVHDQDGRLLLQLPAVAGQMIGLKFSKDGRWLAVRTADEKLVVFDGLAP